ncbi:MAG: phosphatidylinositol-specific phospholipase C1-like protein [Ginsengibacter sp.]
MKKSFARFLLSATFIFIFLFASAQNETNRFSQLRLNQLQIIGSHNSYKPGIEKTLWQIIYTRDSSAAKTLQYGHIKLADQLNMGLRNLELDVVYDPQGGRYENPLGLKLITGAGGTPEPYDTANDLAKPGLKVFHIPDIDFRSDHLLFRDCLLDLKRWSDAHPDHIPVVITMNAKDGNVKGLHELLPFTKKALDSIDLEIRSVFKTDDLITPDLVRGKYPDLESAILKKGWPLVNKVKGRFLFVLDETGEKLQLYQQGHPSLKGRVMFVNETEGHPGAAFMIINDPEKDFDRIQDLVKKGYMIRTRADADTKEARDNDYSTFEAAKKSGAQVITTDYYLPSKYFSSTYKISFDGESYVRANPLMIKNGHLLSFLLSPIIFKGNGEAAWRDPFGLLHNKNFFLF